MPLKSVCHRLARRLEIGSGALRAAAAAATCFLILGSSLRAARAASESILFIGNSFTYADKSPVQYYRTESVTDLNGENKGGVPALFKAFTLEAGLDYAVSLETSPGKGLDWHLANASDKIGRSWDVVVMHGYSTLDAKKPGDPAMLVQTVKQAAQLFHDKNPKVAVYLMATWTRADQTYQPSGHWYGKPVDAMEKEIRAGYDQAAANAGPLVAGVIPVGEAWNRAIETGVADANPYDGLDAGKIDLWTYDNYHASAYGYYLEALMDFGEVTHFDPRSLGTRERCAYELGLSSEQAAKLQQVAYDQLAASSIANLQTFTPVPLHAARR